MISYCPFKIFINCFSFKEPNIAVIGVNDPFFINAINCSIFDNHEMFKDIHQATKTNFENALLLKLDENDIIIPCYTQTIDWLSALGNQKLKQYIPKSIRTSKVIMLGNPYLSGGASIINNSHPLFKLNAEHLERIKKKVNQEIGFNADFILIKDVEKAKSITSDDIILIQSEPILRINNTVNSFQQYLNSFKAKYKKNTLRLLKKSERLTLKNPIGIMPKDKIAEYSALYKKMAEDFKFTLYNVDERYIESIVNSSHSVINEYYLDEKLVGFSLGITSSTSYEAHLVGYDKDYNTDYCIYHRLLCDLIKYGIENQYDIINMGRTSTTMKSGLGAIPIEYQFGFYSFKFPNTIVKRLINFFYPYSKKEDIRNPFVEN